MSSLVVCLGLTACAAEDSAPALHEEASPEVAAQLRPAPASSLAAKVTGASYSGTLCPENSIFVDYPTPDSGLPGMLSVHFGDNIDARDTRISKSCSILADVEVPAGYQFRNMRTSWSSILAAYEDRHVGNVSVTYSYDGQSPQSHTWKPKDGSEAFEGGSDSTDTVTNHSYAAWSPCSSNTSRPSKVRVKVDVGLTAENAMLGVSMFEILDLTAAKGLEWRRCGSSTTIAPPTASAGQTCGPLSASCRLGLTCERPATMVRMFGDDATGTCVARSVRQPAPARRDEPCGGVNYRLCDTGLVCHYPDRSLAVPANSGVCVPVMPKRDETCGGYPNLACGPGLRCPTGGGRLTCEPL